MLRSSAPRTLLSLATVKLCWTIAIVIGLSSRTLADERPAGIATEEELAFAGLLRSKPLELHRLLGRHLTAVAPGVLWRDLPTPEEYKDPTIKYAVFARLGPGKDGAFKDPGAFMRSWKFLKAPYCVSSYSMFILYFNRGFVFKVELRFVADTFAGVVPADNAAYCESEKPLFDLVAAAVGGPIVKREDELEIRLETEDYIQRLSTNGSDANLSWELRGGPTL
ncbi:hypothetical protein [Rhizobium leguminosarum]|uniref:hypothetical protein n=1 Tax=Rhizobium leguminosarum TaxID=384 RepID=UPI001C97B572|nr:hypothetical protein [Rhizobium leguminosarum]MBY5698012.1 hypothetical protein [Rhizobium leguminosarum]